jgi:Flp pilus assembly protein TadG
LTRKEISDHSQTSDLQGERGQGLLEFALVAGFLLLLLFAIIDFSRVFFSYATMSNGVREGARYAVVHPNDDTGIEQATRAMMVVIGAPVDVQVAFPEADVDGGGECRSSRCPVVVTATSDFPVWTPVVPNIQMVTMATMHIE